MLEEIFEFLLILSLRFDISLLQLILNNFGPGIINSGYRSIINSCEVRIDQNEVVLTLERDPVQFNGLYPVEDEDFQLFYLFKELFLYFGAVLAQFLDVFLFIGRTDQGETVTRLY